MHSLGIVQWNSTRQDHPGNPGGVSGSGPVSGPLQVAIYVIHFPLSYKFSTDVLSVQVLKRTSEAFRIQQGQHNNRSPPDVGFLLCFAL